MIVKDDDPWISSLKVNKLMYGDKVVSKSEICRPYYNSMFNILRVDYNVFQAGCMILTSPLAIFESLNFAIILSNLFCIVLL